MNNIFKFNKLIIILSIAFCVIGYFVLNFHYRWRAQDVLMSSIEANKFLFDNNNYLQFSLNLMAVRSNNPSIHAVALYAFGKKRMGDDFTPEFIATSDAPPEGKFIIKNSGFLTYNCLYTFEQSSNVIFVNFSNPQHSVIFLIICLSGFLFFYLFLRIYSYFDFDHIHAHAKKYALSLSAGTLHGLKTHFLHANQLYKILHEQKILHDHRITTLLKDFQNSQVEMTAHMSLMKLDGFKHSTEVTDVKERTQELIDIYKRDRITTDIKFGHQSKLILDHDIFVATVGNLIKNAYDYSDSFVWIRSSEHDGKLLFSIANTCNELTKKDLAHLQKPGFSLQGSSGLGLAICKTWLEKIGATLTILGSGNAVECKVLFPHLEPNAPAEVPNPSRAPLSSSSSLSIAVIDDIDSFRQHVCDELMQNGAIAQGFPSIALFLDRLSQDASAFDMIIVDRHLRGENAVKDRFPDSCRYYGYNGSIILLSCDASPLENDQAQSGFDLVLSKTNDTDWGRIIKNRALIIEEKSFDSAL
jgi:hypothetical protein